MTRGLFSLYSWQYPKTLVYMLQSTEYQAGPYLRWFWRTLDFSHVTKRRTLQNTKSSKLLLLGLRLGIIFQITFGLAMICLAIVDKSLSLGVFGAVIIVEYPLVWAHIIVVFLTVGRLLIVKPIEKRNILASKQVFTQLPAIKIAIAGSYGKTSMKELLLTVLSEGKKVRATPANKNVAISHARFVATLTGNEEIVLIEFGEGKPGDIAKFTEITQPTHAVITGFAPAHLDRYSNLKAAADDIFSLGKNLPQSTYVNTESSFVKPFLSPDYQTYSRSGALGWNVGRVKVSMEGISFTMSKGKQKLTLKSGLLGRHQLGPLAFAAAIGLKLGLSHSQVKRGIEKTQPFEHRMQPRKLHGAWLIDDTYNGNIDGLRAGLALLAELPARRKVYVTPGLVDQGEETDLVHKTLGQLIAKARPDVVVLMHNSVTRYIEDSLKSSGYEGILRIEANPLEFYNNLEHFVAAGDLVLMQNDWTDNYY